MNVIGMLLLAVGFLAGAYATATDTVDTNWLLFVPAVVIAAVGVWLQKSHARSDATSESRLASNRTALQESLRSIIASLESMQTGEQRGEQALTQLIDERLRDDLRRFADSRQSLVHLFNVDVYASIMSEFAAGERYVNRVWSASADGYAHEADTYLGKALGQFKAAAKQLDELSVSASG